MASERHDNDPGSGGVANTPTERIILGDQATVEIEGFPAGTYPRATCSLVALDGPDKGETYTFDKRVVRIGSDVLNDLVLRDPTVSRRHAELQCEDTAWRLVDLESTNGTFVAETRVAEAYLEDGATVTFGKTAMSFHAEVTSQAIVPSEITRFGRIVGQNQGLRQIFAVLDKVAPTRLNVVITGETGTGKELFARAIHERSRRADGPLIVFDCSAFPASLLESELFGHEKGSFSGATAQHKGVFEQADGGTLFLDELGEMDVDLQPKLLRAIETGEFRRVGGTRPIRVDVRVIAATNREVEAMIADGRFRQDLYYRLAQVRFRLPPLRERVDDIPLLVERFCDDLSESAGSALPRFTSQAIEALQAYDWPGNVRELRNVVERAVMLCEGDRVSGSFMRAELGLERRGPQSAPALSALSPATLSTTPYREGVSHSSSSGGGSSTMIEATFENEAGELIPLRDAKEALISDFERRYLEKLLARHSQNISAAAREAQVDRRHFYRLLKKYGLDRGES